MSKVLDEIKNLFSAAVFRRGRSYYEQGRVSDLYYDPVRLIWSAKVKGTKRYQVTVQEDKDGWEVECNCPAFDQYWEPCKHVAAVLLKIYEGQGSSASRPRAGKINAHSLYEQNWKEQQEIRQKQQDELKRREQERQERYLKQLTNQLIDTFASKLNSEAVTGQANQSTLAVDWTCKIYKPAFMGSEFLALEMRTGQKRTYVVKKIREFLKAVQNKEQYYFTKSFSYDPISQEFSKEDKEMISLLLDAVKYEEVYQETRSSYHLNDRSGDERSIIIPPMMADEVIGKLAGREMRFENGSDVFSSLHVYDQELPLSIRLENGKSDGFQLNLSQLNTLIFLEMYGYAVQANKIYRLSPTQQSVIFELMKLVTQSQNSVIPIGNDQIEPFLSYVAPKVGHLAKLEIASQVSRKIVNHPLKAKVFIDRTDEVLHVTLEYHYGDHKLDPLQLEADNSGNDGPILVKDAGKEQAIMDVIESAPLKYNGKMLFTDVEEEIFEFLYETLPHLENKAEIFMTHAVKSLILTDKHGPAAKIDVDSSGNWLEVRFDMDGIEKEDIQNIIRSAVEKKKYYRLPNGTFMDLDTEEFHTIQNMLSEFNIKPSQLQQESIKLPLYRGMQIEELIGKEQQGNAKFGRQFRKLLTRLKNPEALDFELPEKLQAEMRDYQQYGFQWLKTLSYYRFGGILADDMGLGKTLQSIAFILSEKEKAENDKPALIVAPASLVYNWRNEFHKFAPSLKIEVIIGTPQERKEALESSSPADVWITSYPTLRQDMDYYRQQMFSTVILDEAQAIKNHTTKTARAVKEIQSETRFALSGTPIENSIDELWSIFQTIMPDFFPGLPSFRKLSPEKISKMVRPFLLRRVKSDVLKELPEKIESVNYSELSMEQKTLYLGYLEKIQNEARESLQGEGFQKSRIKILAGLTRLRQLCCHPSLFLENYKGGSGKLEQLMEIVQNGSENGRRLLIFSQFTSMLAIIRDHLTNAGLTFFYLDGQTPAKNRVDMVDQYNKGERDIFLISLKAGNTGLNLTGADTVILYDLWWNPAVEEQAAGRAHRIGQKNVVQVIRMITQGTVEEKIYELQQTKKELIETVVQPGDQAIASLTEQEIRDILNIEASA